MSFLKNKNNLLIIVLLLLGFLIRVFFVDKIVVGDLMNYAEWGQKLVEKGPQNYYFSEGWYYSVPVYPPVSIWSFAGAFWFNEHRYILAQLHNLIKFPPSIFIIYFYKWGYIFLLKLFPILCDLGLSFLIYKLIFSLTKNFKKSIIGMLIYLFNPITIFLSGYWGQTDSVVGLLALMAFIFAVNKNVAISLPIMFLSLYYKPSWSVLIPFYLFVTYVVKPKISKFILGGVISLLLFIVTTAPFADKNVFTYGWELFTKRYPLPIGITGKASISAFNFQTIFFKLDIDYSDMKLLLLQSKTWGLIGYLVVNVLAFINFKKQKDKLIGMLSGIFIIGFGSYLFMATMLERYFFPAFVPLIILAFSHPKIIWQFISINIILIANIIYSFYRRGSDEIYHFFIDHNFLLIKLLSIIIVGLYIDIVNKLQSAKIRL